MNASQKKRGLYLGTRIELRGWQRYTKNGFFHQGSGEYWIKDGTLFFQQQKSQQPFCLPLRDLAEIGVCPCQKGSGGIPVLKLVWKKDDHWLSSDFVLPGMVDRSSDLLSVLRSESLAN